MIEWLKRKLAAFGRKEIIHAELPDGIPLHKFKDYESYLKAATGKVWASWKAIDIVASAVTDVRSSLHRRGAQEPIAIPDLDKLLAMPNPFESWEEFVYKVVFHLKATGNAFIVKDETTMQGTRPKALWLLNPKRVKIVPHRTIKVSGYIHSVNGEEMRFDPEEIIHMRRPHGNSDYYGLGDIEAGEALWNNFINRASWEEAFWQNGAAPSGILMCEEALSVANEVEWEKAKRKWQKEYGGSKNSGKTAWLTGKWKYQQLGMTAVDMQEIEKSRFSIENIFLAHGVPLSVAGVRDAANYATAEIADIQFRRWTVKPMVDLISAKLQHDLIRGWGENIELRWNVDGLVSVGQLIASYAPLFDRGGMTINELREKAGLVRDESHPLWNQAFINAGLLPLELAGIADFGQTQQQADAIVSRFLQEKIKPD